MLFCFRLRAVKVFPLCAFGFCLPTFGLGQSPALDPTLPPGGNFDLSTWYLQMPTGTGNSVTTIASANLQGAKGFSDSNYFYTDKTDGAMTFMDPATGITTSGSAHCRTELHESVNWNAIGTNIITVIGEVAQLGGGSYGSVTVGQVFDNNTSKPLGELQFKSGIGFSLLLESTSSGGSGISYSLGAQALGEQYTYSLSFTGTTLTVNVNGAQSTYTPDLSFNGAQFYFKCGDYDQTAASGLPSTQPYTVVKVFSLNVQHLNNSSVSALPVSRNSSAPARLTMQATDPSGEAFFDLRGRTLRSFGTASVFVTPGRNALRP